MIRVCECKRDSRVKMSETKFLIDHGGHSAYCPRCGVKYELVQAPVTGIRVVRELDDDNDDSELYISIEELVDILTTQ